MLAQHEPLLNEGVFEGCNQLTLILLDIAELWQFLVVLDDVIEAERIALRHDSLVAHKALMQVHHERPHLKLLLQVERD